MLILIFSSLFCCFLTPMWIVLILSLLSELLCLFPCFRTFLLSSLQALDVKNRAIQYFGTMPEESFEALPAHIKTKLIDSTNNSAGTDFDKYRLAQGMSTSIIDERSLSISIQAKKEELDKVLGTLKSLCAAKK